MFKPGDKVIAIVSDGYILENDVYIVKHINVGYPNFMLLENIPYIVVSEKFISMKEQRKQKIQNINER
jgi:hypothetical protein